ncbi:MAG: ligase-associated DNA damage response endonuclease PdeM [Pseudomonas fluorescens]|nr:MAG: ligase-associated DNA damage response endonuclease PdeM [Pseudomonas fluorescens]
MCVMPSNRNTREISFGGERLWLDPAAAVYMPDHATLIVSDLHLEKGSFLSQTGAPVPLYDSVETLLNLKSLVEYYKPQQVVLLGDTFHDRHALARLPETQRELLHGLSLSVTGWFWVAGNHDPDLNLDLPGVTTTQHRVGNLHLSHEPVKGFDPLVVGHFHPKISTHIQGHKVKGKVFISDPGLLILPAFGTYAGGLLTTHSIYKEYFRVTPTQFMILRDKIWKIPDKVSRQL